MHVNDRKDGKTVRDSSDVVLETLFQGAVFSKGEKACGISGPRGESCTACVRGPSEKPVSRACKALGAALPHTEKPGNVSHQCSCRRRCAAGKPARVQLGQSQHSECGGRWPQVRRDKWDGARPGEG